MLSSKPSRQIIGALLGCALCFSSTAAGATTTAAAPSISPWLALSALTTPASASAVCAVGAAAISAAQAPAPAPGCVLPVIDTPPPAPVAPAVTPAVASEIEGRGIGVLPILLGLAALGGLAALLLIDGDDEDDDFELSPD